MSVPVLSLDLERAILLEREPANRHRARLVHQEATGRLLAAFFAVYRELGYGFAEAVYTRALHVELAFRGVDVQSDIPMAVYFKGRKVGAFTADFLLEGKVLASVRTGPSLSESDRAQLLNYMRCSRAEVGMLLHFGPRADFQRYLGRSLTECDMESHNSSENPEQEERTGEKAE
jgi:GxxExxY protein